jgi:hypothetical protein
VEAATAPASRRAQARGLKGQPTLPDRKAGLRERPDGRQETRGQDGEGFVKLRRPVDVAFQAANEGCEEVGRPVGVVE